MPLQQQETEREPEMYDWYTKFDFGKYKGETIADVVAHDPKYILWAVENIDWFDVPASVLDEANDVLDDVPAAWLFD